MEDLVVIRSLRVKSAKTWGGKNRWGWVGGALQGYKRTGITTGGKDEGYNTNQFEGEAMARTHNTF